MKRIAIFTSHEGSTCQAILDAWRRGVLPVEIAFVLTNNQHSGVQERAKAAGVRLVVLSSRTHSDPVELDYAIRDLLLAEGVELVILAGYMKKLGPEVLKAFARRVINTHPALLPKYGGSGMYGMRVHRAVLANGERLSGATVHWVDAEYDSGPVIGSVEVPVLKEDSPETLAKRVMIAEKKLLVEIVRKIAVGETP